jgi:hypothetical protein
MLLSTMIQSCVDGIKRANRCSGLQIISDTNPSWIR